MANVTTLGTTGAGHADRSIDDEQALSTQKNILLELKKITFLLAQMTGTEITSEDVE